MAHTPACGVAAVLCPDRETAEAIQEGALYYGGRVFWHPFQISLYKYLLSKKPEDFLLDAIEDRAGFTLPNGGHKGGVPPYKPESTRKAYEALEDKKDIATYLDNTWINMVGDRILYSFQDKPLPPEALNLAILSMYQTFMVLGTGDHAAYEGWNGNMGYSGTMWEDQNYRLAWRLMRRAELPESVRKMILEGLLVVGNRLAFARTIERCNGNAFGHMIPTLGYIAEASGDKLQKSLAKDYMHRFLNEEWGPGTGGSPSGDVQEHFGHSSHYSTYNLQHLTSFYLDLKDEELERAHLRQCEPGRGSTWIRAVPRDEDVSGSQRPPLALRAKRRLHLLCERWQRVLRRQAQKLLGAGLWRTAYALVDR